MKKILICCSLFCCFFIHGQRRGNSGNTRIGLSAGYSHLSLRSDAINFKPLGGFNIGFEQRGMLYDKSDIVYGMSFHQSKVGVIGRSNGVGALDEIDYTSQYFQVYLLGSYRAISNRLNFDFGPIFQLNGPMKYDEKTFTHYKIENTVLTSEDLTDVSQFNFLLTAGVTGGAERVRVGLHYQYGISNFFGKTNDADTAQANSITYKGYTDVITARIIFYL